MILAAVASVLLVPGLVPLLQARVEHKPGFNTFSTQQDIQLGREAVGEIERELALVNDSQLTEYVNRLGQNLSRLAPGYRYPYTFKVVNAKEINAFALPGGPIYIHTGIIAAATTEAQLAGVLAHEISHVALRHSTNQASKAMLAQAPLAILGGVLSGGGGLLGQLAQIGIAFGANSVFLKFSRGAETQADEQGAQILYDAGYDPRAMAQFFEIISKENGGRAGVEFLSSHPNPGNRQNNILELLPKLGPSKSYSGDGSEFQAMKRRVANLAPPPDRPGSAAVSSAPRQPDRPSTRLRQLNEEWVRFGYPDNWEAYGQGTSTVTLVPPEGVVQVQGSLPAIAYGALVSVYEPVRPSGRRLTLQDATGQLVRELQRSNPNLQVSRQGRGPRTDGQETHSVLARGDSPIGNQAEINWIVASFRPEGLWYVVFIAPENAWSVYEPVFRQMLGTVRFPR
jgi:Zn-dependent protease with chaperone function